MAESSAPASASAHGGAVLGRAEIQKALASGQIKITKQDGSNWDGEVGPASVDLKLSNEFRVYRHGLDVLTIDENVNYMDVTDKVVVDTEKPDAGYLILPGQACLGITEETIGLGPGLCGLLEGRSRFARMGLFVHITAGFMQPGISNRQVLEIFNASHNALLLKPGTRICQFIFIRLDGNETYQGRFADQQSI